MNDNIRQISRNLASNTHVLFESRVGANGIENVYPVGTCFYCNSDGYILTCAHGISASMRLKISKPDSVNEHYKYKVDKFECHDVDIVVIDAETDLALLKIKSNLRINISDNLIASPKTVFIGDDIIHVGYPFMEHGHYILKMSKSMVSSKLMDRTSKLYIADGMVYPGNSGGPVFSLKTGTIIGVVSGSFKPFATLARIGNIALGEDSSMIKIIASDHIVELVSSFGIHIND